MEKRSDQPDVSIVIVNWNTAELLHNCIWSIYKNTSSINFEVIVIDNGSIDNSIEMVRLRFADVKIITNIENKGFAAGNNQGVAAAKGRYVLLLNSDTIVLPGSIEKTVVFADSNRQAAVVGCRVLNADKTTQRSCFMFPSILNMFLSSTYLYKLFPRNRLFAREAMGWWDWGDIREVDAVTGCFMLVRAEAIERVGLLDERFFMYAEEADWCYRFKQAGWKVMFTPDCEIIHLGGQSSRKIRGEMLIELRLSILKFIDKHYGWAKHKLACVLTILFFLVRLPVWLIAGVFKSESAKQQAEVRIRAYTGGIKRVLIQN